jgi:hypothetical protein
MPNHKTRAMSVGILILLAYALLGSNNPNQKALSMFLEVTSGVSVLGIAILMYPLFSPHFKELSLWYLGLKWVEALLLVVAGILFYIHTAELLALREEVYILQAYTFGLSALIFYYLLYNLALVPLWLSLWGVMATLLLMLVNLLEITKYIPQVPILYIPIILNEVVLAFWLIIKGFNDENHNNT